MQSSDDSFTTPGSIPFKWEIRPGIPKLQPLPQNGNNNYPSLHQCDDPNRSFPIHDTPLSLKPPPAATTEFSFRQVQAAEPRASSFRMMFSSSSSTIMSRIMCFNSSPRWLKKKKLRTKKNQIQTTQEQSESNYYEYSSDVDSLSFRWSFSTTKSSLVQYPFRGTSPFSDSFSSFRSSPQPQPVKDDEVEWASFAFF